MPGKAIFGIPSTHYDIDPSTGCWNWLRARDRYGYGVVRRSKRLWRTHRYMWTLHRGPIPEGLVLDHLCRNRACCNPDHLEPVTDEENRNRGARSPLSSTCIHGHLRTAENQYVVAGKRHCRPCQNDQSRAWHKRAPRIECPSVGCSHSADATHLRRHLRRIHSVDIAAAQLQAADGVDELAAKFEAAVRALA